MPVCMSLTTPVSPSAAQVRYYRLANYIIAHCVNQIKIPGKDNNLSHMNRPHEPMDCVASRFLLKSPIPVMCAAQRQSLTIQLAPFYVISLGIWQKRSTYLPHTSFIMHMFIKSLSMVSGRLNNCYGCEWCVVVLFQCSALVVLPRNFRRETRMLIG